MRLYALLLLLCLSATVPAATFRPSQTKTIMWPARNDINLGTVTVTHVYEGSRETGYVFVSSSYTTDLVPYTAVTGLDQPRQALTTIEFLPYPFFTGPAKGPPRQDWTFATSIETIIEGQATAEWVTRRTYQGPDSTIIVDEPFALTEVLRAAKTIINPDGSLTADEYFFSQSFPVGGGSVDGIGTPTVSFDLWIPIVPTPEPSALLLICIAVLGWRSCGGNRSPLTAHPHE